jgi:hypothetical protein
MSVRLSHKANQVVFHVCPSVTQSQSSCFSCLSVCHILSFVYLAYIHVCPSVTQSQSSCLSCLSVCHILSFAYLAYIHVCPIVTQSQSSCLSCLSVCHTKPIKLFIMSVRLSHKANQVVFHVCLSVTYLVLYI